jgi:3D-(3,5/4)-trihydroxycyclohexane-1,2-dione acylhydrolase (decyclizing)
VQPFDAGKHSAQPLVADARAGLAALGRGAGHWRAPEAWARSAHASRSALAGNRRPRSPLAANAELAATPGDRRGAAASDRSDIVVCAAGGLPGELHKHWNGRPAGGYHVEYGFSCMGYEIAGGLGVKLAQPDRECLCWSATARI